MHKITLFILCLVLSVQAFADNLIGQYKVRHYTTSQGLPGNTIRDIQQDADGFLWMAGTGGLARFDGYNFVAFNRFGHGARRGIPRHIGKLMLSPSKGQLWVSTATYNQACFDLKEGRFIDYTGTGDDERPYRRIVQTRNGVWMLSNTNGVRHVVEKDGKYSTQDYTSENHKLPSDRVRNLVEDNNGVIWITTDKGLVRVDLSGRAKTLLKGKALMRCAAYRNLVMTYQKDNHTAYIFDSNGKLLRRGVLPTAMGHIGAIRGIIPYMGKWIIFNGEETFALDMKTGVFSKPAECQVPNGYESAHIGNLYFVGNKTGSLWIFSEKGGVRKLDLFENMTQTRDRNSLFSVSRGNDGKYYIGTYGGGLFVYDYATGSIEQFTAEDRNPIIFSNYVIYVTTDRSGCVWVSTENGGVTCLTSANNMAKYYLIDDNSQGDWTNAILHILPTVVSNTIKIETKRHQFYTFSLADASFHYDGEISYAISGYIKDKYGHVWTATRGEGLLYDNKKIDVVADGKNVETSDYTVLRKDNYGHLWIGTWGQGLMVLEKVKDGKARTRNIITSQFNESRINTLAITKNGILCVATLNGLYVLDAGKINIAKNVKPKIYLYSISTGNFPADEINCVCPAGKDVVWVGTIGGGLVRCDFSKGLDKMTYKSLTIRDGLSNDNIRSLVVDKKGYLWVGTDDGLSRVDPKDNYIRRYELTNNVLCNTFDTNCGTLLADGRLAFGTSNGLVIVNPLRDKPAVDADKLSRPLISDLYINGQSIYEGLDSTLTDRALPSLEKIRLSNNQNSLTFYFSSCDYHEIPSQVYQYYLEGLDKQWRPVTGINHAEYSNLSPGNYVFHLRIVTPHHESKETLLKVHIAEPWYNTVWAWMVYLFFIGALIFYLYRNAQEKLRMHQQVKVEKQVAEFRTTFFTHVTHEFRTPLAILQNAVERISRPGNPSRKDIQTAQRGVKRLLRLVNQFLEYRRMESGKLRLQVEKGNIISFVQDIFLDFRNMAEKKNITINFTPFTKSYSVRFDPQIVESVVYNLISNAIKYTPENGNIVFSVKHDEDTSTLQFIVEDNGPGISLERQEGLFKPFNEGHVSKGGMGIGLYTSHNIAEIHHGSLDYENVNPHGSRFIFSIPDNDNAYTQEEYAAPTKPSTERRDDSHYDEVIREMAPIAINNQRVAIVEDDPDMQEQIASEVGIYFKTSIYGTGESAIAGIEGNPPSLILCDIMLPDTNGYEIVKKLKEKDSLRSIPVIMLTALDDESHQIKGYQVGADDYMVKPCNYHLLIARMMQLIQWHEKRLTEEKNKPESTEDTTTQEEVPSTGTKQVSDGGVILTSRADKRFKEQVETLVSQHIDDQALSVDRLAEMMSMGRTKFYGKVKDIFGMSPNKYLLARRMEAAASLLDEGKYNVSEVSYMVGFADPAYFNKCFKAHFGMVPSKYKER